MDLIHEASFYKKLNQGIVQCNLCHRGCVIKEGAQGKCGVRKNVGGKLYSLVYGKTLTTSIDPIEKKPLFHFKPGTRCLGVSTFGCNFFCMHCQNWDISQQRTEEVIEKAPITTPKELVQKTLDTGVEGIAYTYTEPTIFAEYALDTMKEARKKGLYNVWVSNGYMTKECIDEIVPYLDAINIDLKGDARFYEEVCGKAKIDFVKENIKYLHKKGIHLEVTNLVVPDYNDTNQDFKETAEFIASIDPLIPLHFTRFYPQYKMQDRQPTELAKLHLAHKTAIKAGLKYVYVGNIVGEESTLCPKCNAILVKRVGFAAAPEALKKNGKCAKCGFKTGIIT
ncbi:MAG: AmmeMemoRadiSam system radical SAM enzyme [Candidatus Diapherotrites archaeon]|uniref:AmmeMemoRadiSam system radical SAM enzyme n=1 Tax=Candidatus Iainarchaeum sp. TaxID=3101447 RepID=A0A2D6M1A8_9ARCH|nr:AmmeMemoRadiSam system radical SAM enzyme [Candidatus Diapherotrites archaeon]